MRGRACPAPPHVLKQPMRLQLMDFALSLSMKRAGWGPGKALVAAGSRDCHWSLSQPGNTEKSGS